MGVSYDGIDKLVGDLLSLAEGVDDLCADMLDAATDTAIQDWRSGIVKAGHYDTGSMYNSVGVAHQSSKLRVVYPLGEDAKGVRNAEKAYIINYGKKGAARGDRFVDVINAKADEDTYREMCRVYDDRMKKKGF